MKIKFVEILSSELAKGFTNKYFYSDDTDGAIVFTVPSDGETTKGSNYPRTELRQTGSGSDWQLTDVSTHYLRVLCRVIEVAQPKPQVIIGQVHGSTNDSEIVKIRWTGDKPGLCYIEARFQKNDKTKEEYGVSLARNLTLGDMIDYTITMTKGTITVTINNESTSQTYTTQFYGTNDQYYFKAGNYLQYNGKDKVFNGRVKVYLISLIPAKK